MVAYTLLVDEDCPQGAYEIACIRRSMESGDTTPCMFNPNELIWEIAIMDGYRKAGCLPSHIAFRSEEAKYHEHVYGDRFLYETDDALAYIAEFLSHRQLCDIHAKTPFTENQIDTLNECFDDWGWGDERPEFLNTGAHS